MDRDKGNVWTCSDSSPLRMVSLRSGEKTVLHQHRELLTSHGNPKKYSMGVCERKLLAHPHAHQHVYLPRISSCWGFWEPWLRKEEFSRWITWRLTLWFPEYPQFFNIFFPWWKFLLLYCHPPANCTAVPSAICLGQFGQQWHCNSERFVMTSDESFGKQHFQVHAEIS